MDIRFEEFTSGTLEGTGSYDKLMKINSLHIQQEYAAGRIKSTEYAATYLGLLQSSMQTAMEFMLREKELEVRLESENTKLLMDAVAQYGYESAVIGIDGKITLGARSDTEGIFNKQETAMDKDIELKTKQIESINVEDTIKQESHDKNMVQLDEAIKVTITQKVKLDKETALLGLDDVLLINKAAKTGAYVYSPSYTI